MDNDDPTGCGACGASGCQLWRSYGTFYRPDTNRCTACAITEQGKQRERDSIGWMVPLILSVNGDVWGFTSCPDEDVDRWRALPLVPPIARRQDVPPTDTTKA